MRVCKRNLKGVGIAASTGQDTISHSSGLLKYAHFVDWYVTVIWSMMSVLPLSSKIFLVPVNSCRCCSLLRWETMQVWLLSNTSTATSYRATKVCQRFQQRLWTRVHAYQHPNSLHACWSAQEAHVGSERASERGTAPAAPDPPCA